MKSVKTNKIAALSTAGVIAFANLGIATPVLAANETKLTLQVHVAVDYELVVPADTTVSGAGWHNLASDLIIKNLKGADKINKITVDAGSGHNWKFVSGTNEIGYDLKKDASDTGATISYDFEEKDEMKTDTGQKFGLGIDVEDYSNKPDGDYKDNITWTAAVDKVVKGIKIMYDGREATELFGATVNQDSSIMLTADVDTTAAAVDCQWSWTAKSDGAEVLLTEDPDDSTKVTVTGKQAGDVIVKVRALGAEASCKVTVQG